MKLLVVSDDGRLDNRLVSELMRAGFAVVRVGVASVTRGALEQERPDLVLLTINRAGSAGLGLVQELVRASAAPVMVIAAAWTEEEVVQALDLGADDCMTRPISYRLLVARVSARMRRRAAEAQPSPPSVLRVGPLALDVDTGTVTRNGRLLHVTPVERDLLRYLMIHNGRVMSASLLQQEVWGMDDPASGVVRVTVHRLRQKIEDDPTHPRLLRTVQGSGFVLRAEE